MAPRGQLEIGSDRLYSGLKVRRLVAEALGKRLGLLRREMRPGPGAAVVRFVSLMPDIVGYAATDGCHLGVLVATQYRRTPISAPGPPRH